MRYLVVALGFFQAYPRVTDVDFHTPQAQGLILIIIEGVHHTWPDGIAFNHFAFTPTGVAYDLNGGSSPQSEQQEEQNGHRSCQVWVNH